MRSPIICPPDTGKSAEYNHPLLHLSKFFIKRRVLIKNVRTAGHRRSFARSGFTILYNIQKRRLPISVCKHTRTHSIGIVFARRSVRVMCTKRGNPPSKWYIRDYHCARKLFRISWNRDDPIIMNFPPRRLLEMEHIDTLVTYWQIALAISAGHLRPVICRQSGFQFSRYERESIHPRPCLLGPRAEMETCRARRRYDTQ